MISRLYLRFYAALLGSLIVFALFAGFVVHRLSGPPEHFSGAAGVIIQNALPPADAPPAEQQRVLQNLLAGSEAHVVLRAADGSVIAMAPPREMHAHAHADETSPALIFRLPDGRSVTTHATIEWLHPLGTLVLCLSVLALAVGVGAYPIVRPLTRRLERLQAGVESGCIVLVDDQGAVLANLIGLDAASAPVGSAVQVKGRFSPDLMTTCQQGEPFTVASVEVG